VERGKGMVSSDLRESTKKKGVESFLVRGKSKGEREQGGCLHFIEGGGLWRGSERESILEKEQFDR